MECWFEFADRNGIPRSFQIKKSENPEPCLAVIGNRTRTRVEVVPDHTCTHESSGRPEWSFDDEQRWWKENATRQTLKLTDEEKRCERIIRDKEDWKKALTAIRFYIRDLETLIKKCQKCPDCYLDFDKARLAGFQGAEWILRRNIMKEEWQFRRKGDSK